MDDLNSIILNNRNVDLQPIISLVNKLIRLNYIESVFSVGDIYGFVDKCFAIDRYNKNEIVLLNKLKKNLIIIHDKAKTKESISVCKYKVIGELKKQIEKLNDVKHLRIKDILCDGVIDNGNLQFALDFLYNEDLIKYELNELKRERMDQTNIDETYELLVNIKEIKSIILGKIDEIIDLFLDDDKPSKLRFFSYLRWVFRCRENRLVQENILHDIGKLIEDSMHKKENKALRVYCFEELTSLNIIYEKLRRASMNGMSKKIFVDLKDRLSIEYDVVIDYIDKILSFTSIKKARIDNNEHFLRLNEYLNSKKNNYVSYIINNIIQPRKNKLDTLFFQIILILKYVYYSENSISNFQNRSLEDSVRLSNNVLSEFDLLGFKK